MSDRKVSDAYVVKVFAETNSIVKTARRISRSYVATARRLHRLGLVNTKTARSR
jgi:uridine kinase